MYNVYCSKGKGGSGSSGGVGTNGGGVRSGGGGLKGSGRGQQLAIKTAIFYIAVFLCIKKEKISAFCCVRLYIVI